MMLPQSSARIAQLKAQGKVTRARLLKLVPDVFTARDLAEAANLSAPYATEQVRRMQHWGEVVAVEPLSRPRRYRKVTP